jgi:lipopolysaccharide export LptBFGC system permease protein LptF
MGLEHDISTLMTELTPYRKLGVTENASFEEIKEARDRLIVQLDGDTPGQELIESAYDAILMDRLRARQEGKVKVPEGIRFPEKNVIPPLSPLKVNSTPDKLKWLADLQDQPTRKDLLTYTAVFGGLFALSFLFPKALSSLMALALFGSIYFLRQKENRFWRSLLLGITGLVLGVIAGMGLLSIGTVSVLAPQIAVGVIFMVMYLVTALFR